MGRRRDAFGIDLLHLAGVGEDLAELARKEVEIRLVELKVGQGGDSLDLLAHETLRHRPILQCPMIRGLAVAGCSYPCNPTSLAVATVVRWASRLALSSMGIGGLGHLGVQFAVTMGFKTVAIARGTDQELLARKLGRGATSTARRRIQLRN
jgi:hypothetical protein